MIHKSQLDKLIYMKDIELLELQLMDNVDETLETIQEHAKEKVKLITKIRKLIVRLFTCGIKTTK